MRRIDLSDIRVAREEFSKFGIDNTESILKQFQPMAIKITKLNQEKVRKYREAVKKIGGNFFYDRAMKKALIISSRAGMEEIIKNIGVYDISNHHPLRWTFGNFDFDLCERVLVMGVINLSSDSFYPGSYYAPDQALKMALQMVEQGADIIDIGGQSTRPGSEAKAAEEEVELIKDILPQLTKKLEIPVSIDTYKAEVAQFAFDHGAKILNDISALTFDEKMVDVVKHNDCGIIAMHIKGRPKDMQDNPEYQDLMDEIYGYIEERVAYLHDSGINRERIAVDPGLGFGKKLEDNYKLINRLDEFKQLNRPILVGISRKSFTGIPLNIPPEERLASSIALTTIAIRKGARIIRTHDVKEMKHVVDIIEVFQQ